jgi:uncharacterized protein YgbK (DUF1537 family)
MSGLLLSYYGDDFTGSTDVMEALAKNGVKTVLFTRQPADVERRRFAGYQAIGLAGASRSQPPEWMDIHLKAAFEWLKTLRARFCHYKVCSTFDSSPAVGNIGRAVEIGRTVFGQQSVPLVVGAPQLRRYTAFGQLFAAYQDQVYRIDRHPVMSRHPVTPMSEADLRLHLARQTSLPVALVGFDLLQRKSAAAEVAAIMRKTSGIVLFDVIDETTQRAAGLHLLDWASSAGPFVAGSSGVEYALMKALGAKGEIAGTAQFDRLAKADRLLVVSGSCSPTTERQIRHALANGFAGIEADPVKLHTGRDAEMRRVIEAAVRHFADGRSIVIFTALGHSTDKGAALDALAGARHGVGVALGSIARALIARAGLNRVVFAGGDSSSHALGQLGILALTTRYPLKSAPGSPLCTAHSLSPELNGLDLALKGGQLGGEDYFVQLRDGVAAGA